MNVIAHVKKHVKYDGKETSRKRFPWIFMLFTAVNGTVQALDGISGSLTEHVADVTNSIKMPVSVQIFPSGDVSGVTDALVIQATLDAATDSVRAHTTITLGAGEFYLDNDLIIGPSQNLTVRGKGASDTILHLLSCNQTGFRLVAPQSLGQAIKNLTIERLSIHGFLESAEQANACLQVGIGNFSGQAISGVKYQRLAIHRVAVGISANADLGGVFEGARILSNHITDVYGTNPGRGYGIHVANAHGARIYKNLIERAERHSIYQARGTHSQIQENALVDHRSTVADGSIRAAMVVARSASIVVSGNRFIGSHDVALAIGPDPEQPGIARNISVFDNDFEQSHFLDIYIGSQQDASGQLCADGYPESIYALGNRFRRNNAGSSVRIECGKRIRFAENRWVSVNEDSPIVGEIRLISIVNDENYTDRIEFKGNCGRLETASIAAAYTLDEDVANGSGHIELSEGIWNADSIVYPLFEILNPNLLITDSLQDVACLP